MKLSGNFLYWDQKNLNGYSYSKETIERIIEQTNKRIEEGTALGELGYPVEEKFDEIYLANVSHKIEEIHINEENKSIEGTIEILDTPAGQKVKGMVEDIRTFASPVELSCRPRGRGEVNENREIENYEIISFDLVRIDDDAFANIQPNDGLRMEFIPGQRREAERPY